MSRLRIKICGVTHDEHIDAAAESGADLVGVVLWPKSPRAVSLERGIALARHAHAKGLESVALVVDPDPGSLAELEVFTRVQFHGNEVCELLGSTKQPTIRGFPFAPDALRVWDRCPHVTWLLVDGPRGGGGEAFDHRLLPELTRGLTKPWLLAGGLTPDNVAQAIMIARPYGVDVSSGVERSRGVKDPERIRSFCAAARRAAASYSEA